MSEEKHHIVPYRVYIIVLLALLALTFASIGITSIELGEYTVAGALIFACIKSFLVLTYFMHLKYDKKYIRAMVVFVFVIFVVMIVITFLDYLYR
ncbi:MAG: cytochrome-c oxidase [Prolixibacteraceae bacterium]|jgi:cytochrome c oxidase subunit IV|nr:cytochrome-c oxidase [Prolixibacteraceae bacterium]MBT6004836.1 cytochrome-c oxidase [Prolixibacteraceae bacterium]MBT6763580.1 cytochrome-c oxidase [Prolixibacteraceae bacterium]MBT7001023.1 cytochrome-c oxidase [Prolixibacteraceae bacterium]MBT7393689.1 cytochrome-c oxidase [Prolixibacteraceae bacterium]